MISRIEVPKRPLNPRVSLDTSLELPVYIAHAIDVLSLISSDSSNASFIGEQIKPLTQTLSLPTTSIKPADYEKLESKPTAIPNTL